MAGDRIEDELLEEDWYRPLTRTGAFTLLAQSALHAAIEEALLLNHDYVGTEHLLLGLLRTRDGAPAKVLAGLGVDRARVTDAVVALVGRGEGPTPGRARLATRAKRAVDAAVEEARRLKHQDVAAQHLLLGLLRIENGTALRVLESLGVSAEQVRQRLMAAVFTEARAAAHAGPKDTVVTCRMNQRDLDAIDGLVEAGIRATRSDAVTWLVCAGIEAHRPLFERVYATVGEIRRLREDAQAIAQEVQEVIEPPRELREVRAGTGASGVGGSSAGGKRGRERGQPASPPVSAHRARPPRAREPQRARRSAGEPRPDTPSSQHGTDQPNARTRAPRSPS